MVIQVGYTTPGHVIHVTLGQLKLGPQQSHMTLDCARICAAKSRDMHAHIPIGTQKQTQLTGCAFALLRLKVTKCYCATPYGAAPDLR